MRLREVMIASSLFASLTLIFFYKIFLGLIPLPTDLTVGAYYPWLNYKWGDYIVGVPVQNPKLSDAVSLYYPFKSLAADLMKKGELPLWNPYMFGGYPLLANVQAAILFPTMIFYLLFSSPIAWTLQVMSQPFLASFFMYILLRHLKLKNFPSVFGSIVYGFGGSTILWIQWNTQATTSLFLPILILLEDKYLISKSLKWGALLSIFICLQIFAGYLPIIPFTVITMAIWYLFRSQQYISDLKILFFIILGVSLSAVFLLPVVELIKISQRVVEVLDKNVPFFAPENLINLIAPDFFGNPATANFWGRGDNMDSTIYVGITTLIFALLCLKKFFSKSEMSLPTLKCWVSSLLSRNDSAFGTTALHPPTEVGGIRDFWIIKFALCIFIVALTISISNPISLFLYNLGLWGGPSITMNRVNFLINFALAILGAYGISTVKNYAKLSLKSAIWILSTVLGLDIGLLLCKYFLQNTITSIPISANEITILLTHINISLRNLILPLLIVVAVSVTAILCNYFRRLKAAAPIIFTIILILELFRFGLKFNTFSTPDFLYPETPISKYLEKYPNDRFIAEKDIFPANMWVPFKISSIQGYDGIYPLNTAKLLAVADFNNLDTPPKPRWGIVGNFNSKILDETNTRFLLAVKKDDQDRAGSDGAVAVTIPSKFKEVFEDKGIAILENTKALPRVYLTKKVIKASDKDTLKLMIDDNFPIQTTSITDDFEFNNASETLNAELTYNPLTNSHVQIKITSNIDAYLVVLDSFYPGWKALIDGKESEVHRTNYNFRGIILPKGTHIVEFKYIPKSLEYGVIISGISLIIILLLLITPRYKSL